MTGKLTLTIKCVTPIFLGGSQAGSLAETIRPASIRGQARYWLRAILGAGIDPAADDALNRLKVLEGRLMGNTEAGSPVRFRVRAGRPPAYVEKNNPGRRMLPHRMAGVPDTPQNNRRNQPLSEAAFLEDQQFDLILSPRPGLRALPDEVVAAVLLWLALGGLGKRARRGFGSLQPVKWAADEGVISATAREYLPGGQPADAAALRSTINALLKWAGGLSPRPPATWSAPSDYPILHPDVAGVRVSEAVKGYHLEEGYHEAMVPFWKETLRSDELYDDYAYGYATRKNRRASPFHFHIAHSAQGYHQVFTTFWANIPEVRNERDVPPPDWGLVSNLLTDVETRFGATNLWGRAL